MMTRQGRSACSKSGFLDPEFAEDEKDFEQTEDCNNNESKENSDIES